MSRWPRSSRTSASLIRPRRLHAARTSMETTLLETKTMKPPAPVADVVSEPETAAPVHETPPARGTVVGARHVNVHYGDNHAIKDVSVDIAENEVTAFIGPSGCGKSTFLRCINRM